MGDQRELEGKRGRIKDDEEGKGVAARTLSCWAEERCDTSFKYVGFVRGLYCTTWTKFI